MLLALTGLHPAPAWAERAPLTVEGEIADSSKLRSDLEDFYAARGHRPIWISRGSVRPEADKMIALVADAEADGLDPDDYKLRALRKAVEAARSKPGDAEALARAELLLSRALVDYVRDVRRPRSVGIIYLDRDVTPAVPTVDAVLGAAARAPSLGSWLDGEQWTNEPYAELREAFLAYKARWGELPQARISTGPALGPGASGERVSKLRKRLGLVPEGTFDGAVAARLREFKAVHGLPAGPLADPETIAALNKGASYYEKLIRLNLDRARALPANLGRRFIMVDTLGARLDAYENGRVRETMKVIVGKPAEPTPMLAGLVRYAVVNPYWNVPPDLVRVRVAPKVLANGVSYFRSMRYEALSGWGEDAAVMKPEHINWTRVASGGEELRVRQLPGKDNMMGRVKFMFPNEMGVYLHDTPDRELFADADRLFSSGCIRLENARRLGTWLFGKPLAARTSAPEQHVNLAEPVPIYVTYFTAVPAKDGVRFRKDIYGRDQSRSRKR
jgi:murein L,D-transpeptidase YcbB/YkuD